MELTNKEAATVKRIYSEYHANEINADEALSQLETLINEGEWFIEHAKKTSVNTSANTEETYSNEPFLGGQLDISLWSEILPNLWQGGTGDEDRVGDKHYQFDRQAVSLTKRNFDSVYTFYAHANPTDWLVKEFRYGFFDSEETSYDLNAFKRIVVQAHTDWSMGERVLIRCQAGLNRSGLICALVLIREGYEPTEAISLMREKRHEKVLFNPHFVAWLESQDVNFWRA